MGEWININEAFNRLQERRAASDYEPHAWDLLRPLADGELVAHFRNAVTREMEKLPVEGWKQHSIANPEALLSHPEIQENECKEWSTLVGVIPVLDAVQFDVWMSRFIDKKSAERVREDELRAKHDPMQEQVWTAPMAFAWVIYQTPKAVQDRMDSFCEDMNHKKPTLWEIYTQSEVGQFDEAKQALWRHLLAGNFGAMALDKMGNPIELQGNKWGLLKPYLGDEECGHLQIDDLDEPVYFAVRFLRDDILKIWPDPSNEPSCMVLKGKDRERLVVECTEYLVDEMNKNLTENPHGTIPKLIKHCQTEFSGLSVRAARDAVRKADLELKSLGFRCTWSDSGFRHR
ncbi:MAG: hypothetical protein ABJH63_20110 [Rhizobiaceae bacterium]